MDHYLPWIYDTITSIFVEGTASFITLIMSLPLTTKFYGSYSVEMTQSATVYNTVSGRVTDHPGNSQATERWY